MAMLRRLYFFDKKKSKKYYDMFWTDEMSMAEIARQFKTSRQDVRYHIVHYQKYLAQKRGENQK